MEIYDISQNLRRGIAVWPGDPEFSRRWIARIRNGDASNVSAVDLCVHTGTHVDAPRHLTDDGRGVAALPPERFVGPARVIAVPDVRSIGVDWLESIDWAGVQRVLFKTRGSGLPDDRFDRDFVFLDEDAARFLVRRGIGLAGTDAPSVDPFDSESLPAHRILLERGIVILEGIRLKDVAPGDYELICLPLKLEDSDGSPVRAILRR